MTAAELNPDFRNLIDSRLDAIEQILLRVQVSYSERRHIVGEVETQVFELVARRSDNPIREDVVAVLDTLDPPQAYVPEELRSRLGEAPTTTVIAKPAGPRLSKLAVGSAALVVLLLLFGIPFVFTSHARDTEAIAAFFGFDLFLATLLGVGALVRVLRSDGRLRGLPFAMIAVIVFPMILVNSAAVALAAVSQGLVPWIITIAGLAYLNFLGVRWLWRWIGEKHAAIADALRGDVAHWFAPKNGIQPT